MSAAQVIRERPVGASPLMSNNPFRNKIASSQSQVQSQPPQPIRPVSTNPFLDLNELPKEPLNTVGLVPSDGTSGTSDLFASMQIGDKQQSPERNIRPTLNGVVGRPENALPRPLRSPPLAQRPSVPEEDKRRQGMLQRRGTELDIFADPFDTASIADKQSLRRNSESSVRDKPSLLDSEEDKKKRDKKSRDPRYGKYKPSRKMDVIDKLDVTSIYGAGLFHHDGPFDACNPNRNKRRHRYAPMQAFPKDSLNMQLGGPAKLRMDYDKFHGHGQEAHVDFNEAAVVDEDAEYMRRAQPPRTTSFTPIASFHPTARDHVHGHETAGLGTSTFLEGAPASRAAIQRRESEMNEAQEANGGLSRKKSLANKLRGVRGGSNRVQSPDSERPPNPNSPLPTGRSDSFANPFFRDYDKDNDKKGLQTSQAEDDFKGGRARALSSPRQASAALDNSRAAESVQSPQENKPSGFLGRMKSLKKTKSRPDRRDVS